MRVESYDRMVSSCLKGEVASGRQRIVRWWSTENRSLHLRDPARSNLMEPTLSAILERLSKLGMSLFVALGM